MTSRLIIFLTFILASCSNKQDVDKDISSNIIANPESKWFKKKVLFNDSNYIFTLTTIDTTYSIDTEKPTVVANLFRLSGQKIDTLINDSLFCRNPNIGETNEYDIEFADFNFDGVKDIFLPAGTDPRQNYGVHLYVIDNKAKTIKYVEGFQKIGNPQPDTINNIIISTVLSGQVFTKFYAFNANNDIIDLGHTFTSQDTGKDSVNFRRNFEKVLKERKQRTSAL